eukprot:COSAG02_NODE_345_length_24135_cov_6.425404_17_plen_189_part_00
MTIFADSGGAERCCKLKVPIAIRLQSGVLASPPTLYGLREPCMLRQINSRLCRHNFSAHARPPSSPSRGSSSATWHHTVPPEEHCLYSTIRGSVPTNQTPTDVVKITVRIREACHASPYELQRRPPAPRSSKSTNISIECSNRQIHRVQMPHALCTGRYGPTVEEGSSIIIVSCQPFPDLAPPTFPLV